MFGKCPSSPLVSTPDRLRSSLSTILGSVLLALLTVGCGQKDTAPAPAPAGDGQPAPTAQGQPVAGQPAQDAPQAGKSETDPVELEFWKSISDSEHTDDFWAYLERYPDGAFADLAKTRIERLSKAAGSSGGSSGSASNTTPPPPSTARASRSSIVRSAIQRELRGYSDRRLHIAPDIPRFKLDNVAQLHGLDPRRVILLYDDGSGGGGKTGFCLTDRRIYWRLIAGEQNYFLDYEDISQVRAGRSSFTVNGYEVPTSLANNSTLAAERFADMVETISYEMRRR